MTLAPILMSFSRKAVSDQCSTSVGDAPVRLWLCVDGPGLARVVLTVMQAVGCSYVFGLFARHDDRWP